MMRHPWAPWRNTGAWLRAQQVCRRAWGEAEFTDPDGFDAAVFTGFALATYTGRRCAIPWPRIASSEIMESLLRGTRFS